MTIQRRLNRHYTTGNATPFEVLKCALSAGWTCERSGSGNDGVFDTADVFASVVEGDDIVTSGPGQNVGLGSGLEAMGNRNCWFVLRDPDGNREWQFRRREFYGSGDDDHWSVFFSPGALYVGGDASNRATAVDEVQMWDAANVLFANGGQSCVLHTAFDEDPAPSGEYGFVSVTIIATNDIRTIVSSDDLRETAVGDPCPIGLMVANGPTDVGFFSDGNTFYTITTASGFSRGRMCWPHNYTGQGQVGYDGAERHPELTVVEPLVQGYLGVSRWFRAAAIARDYPNTGDSETFLYADDCTIADLLDGGTTPDSI